MTTTANEFRVMTSGAFTAAHLALIPQLERLTKKTIVTASTSVGTGETSIPNRLKRGEIVDIVIVADTLLRQLIEEGLVLADGYTPLARSGIGMAVFAAGFFMLQKLTPFDIVKEIETDHNTALGIVIGCTVLGLAFIVGMAIHG